MGVIYILQILNIHIKR